MKGNMNEALVNELKGMAQRLTELFPEKSVEIASGMFGDHSFSIWNPGNYNDAVNIMRELGVKDREKNISPDHFNIKGKTPNGILVTMCPSGLPPSCKRVEYVERIPIEKTVATDEFIEVKRTKIVCSGAKNSEKQG